MLNRIRNRVAALVGTIAVAASLSASPLEAQNIQPTGPLGTFTFVGSGWYQDVGQSFTAGGLYLNSFSFWLGKSTKNLTPTGDGLSGAELIPYVMAWDGNSVVGDVLFQGASTLVSGLTGFQEFQFSTGDLLLAPGSMYIAFLQAASNPLYTGNVAVAFGGAGSGASADNKQGQTVKPLTDTWDLAQTNVTTTFAATFSDTPVTATPEPASLVLLATGVVGVLGTTRLRRKKA